MDEWREREKENFSANEPEMMVAAKQEVAMKMIKKGRRYMAMRIEDEEKKVVIINVYIQQWMKRKPKKSFEAWQDAKKKEDTEEEEKKKERLEDQYEEFKMMLDEIKR